MRKMKSAGGNPWFRRLLPFAVMIAALAALLSQTAFAQNSYVITDGGSVTVHRSYSTDPDVVLDEVGIELSEEDTYTTTYDDGVGRINIRRMQMVTVIDHGVPRVIGTYGETVGALVERLGVKIGPSDSLSCDRLSLTFDGMVVEVVCREVTEREYDETTPREVRYLEDPTLAEGESMILVEGADGVVHYHTQTVYENGREISTKVLEQTEVSEMVPQLVVTGSDRSIASQPDEPDHRVPDSVLAAAQQAEQSGEPQTVGGLDTIGGGVITTSTGTTYTYTNVLSVSATAYSCEGYVGHTYSGTVARVGAIAVDPKVIPLGTKLYVVSDDGQYIYGYCVAEDIGGGIKGNRIDLYFDTFDECWQFGVRQCTVYILG